MKKYRPFKLVTLNNGVRVEYTPLVGEETVSIGLNSVNFRQSAQAIAKEIVARLNGEDLFYDKYRKGQNEQVRKIFFGGIAAISWELKMLPSNLLPEAVAIASKKGRIVYLHQIVALSRNPVLQELLLQGYYGLVKACLRLHPKQITSSGVFLKRVVAEYDPFSSDEVEDSLGNFVPWEQAKTWPWAKLNWQMKNLCHLENLLIQWELAGCPKIPIKGWQAFLKLPKEVVRVMRKCKLSLAQAENIQQRLAEQISLAYYNDGLDKDIRMAKARVRGKLWYTYESWALYRTCKTADLRTRLLSPMFREIFTQREFNKAMAKAARLPNSSVIEVLTDNDEELIHFIETMERYWRNRPQEDQQIIGQWIRRNLKESTWGFLIRVADELSPELIEANPTVRPRRMLEIIIEERQNVRATQQLALLKRHEQFKHLELVVESSDGELKATKLTPQEAINAGHKQHHCLGSYASMILEGTYQAYEITNGTELWHLGLELANAWPETEKVFLYQQCYGVCNSNPPLEVREFCDLIVAEANKQLKEVK